MIQTDLSVTGKVCAESTGKSLSRLNLLKKFVSRLSDWLEMTLTMLARP